MSQIGRHLLNLSLPRHSGIHCTEVDHCASNPCYNGDCVSTGDSFRCDCDDGFYGPDCRLDVNECQTSPCYYGKCINTHGSYT